MKALILCVLLLPALAGCDRQQYEYVVRYQEVAGASVDLDGRRVFLTARASFVDAQPAPVDAAGAARGEGGMTAEDRYRYVVAHPETFGPIASREEYEEHFGAGAGESGDACTIEIVVSGDYPAAFTVSPRSAALDRGGQAWAALEGAPARLAAEERPDNLGHHGEGAPVRIRFPALPRVAATGERLTAWQIQRRPAPAADPIALTLALEHDGRLEPVVFTFDRVALHPPLPPNPLYWLYAAH